MSEDLYDGLHCSGTLEGTLRTVVELSGRDMRRRKFLLGSAFSAAAFSEPVGRHSPAQRYAIQALDLAMAAGDRLYAPTSWRA